MVKQCLVCHQSYVKGGHRSFHLLPLEPELRMAWLEIVGVVDLEYPKYTYLCSDHFSSEDYEIKPGGYKFLKRGSLPLPSATPRLIVPSLYQSGFPVSRPRILARWLEFAGLKADQLNSTSFLCGDHFTEDSFTPTAIRTKLKSDAVPVLAYIEHSGSQYVTIPTDRFSDTYTLPDRLTEEDYSTALRYDITERVMEIDDEDDAMEIDETVQSGQIIERRSDEFTLTTLMPSNLSGDDNQSNEESSKTIVELGATKKKIAQSGSSSIGKNKGDKSQTMQKKSGPSKASSARSTVSSKDSDIVILDDDDDGDDVTMSNSTVVTSPKKKADSVDKVEAIIDLVEPVTHSKCINYSCKSGKDLMVAPGMCLSYYRVKCSANKVKEVCQECYDTAIKDYDKLVTQLKSGNILFEVDVPLRNDMVEIDDSDEEADANEEEPDYLDEESNELIKKEIDDVINNAMKQFNLDNQIEKEIGFLKTKSKTVSKDLRIIDNDFKAMRKTLDDIQISLYNHFRPDLRELKGLDVIDDVTFNYQNVYHQNDASRRFGKPPTQHAVNRYPPVIEIARRPIITTTSAQGTDRSETEMPKDLPRVGPIEKPPLKLGETYYIIRITGAGSWIRGRLIQSLCTEPQPNKPSAYMYKVIELKQLKERMVTGKQIAYMTPSNVRLEVGTRVLAAFKELGHIGESKKSRSTPYYPGIVAEPPVASNKYRYLIFFDIGYAQYVDYSLVNLVLESSSNVWEDMAPDSQQFIRKYLQSQDHPMIKIAKDQTVRTEYNGKWWLCTVMNIDCSLVQVFFDALNRMEWIFRGSTRLSPIFREERAATNRQASSRTIPRKLGTNETATVVQYTRASDFIQPEPPAPVPAPVRAVARKSTTKPQTPIAPPANAVPFLPVQSNTSNSSTNITGPTSKIMYFTPRDQVITKRPYRPHTCSPKCKEYLTHNFTKLRGHNPLSKPLLCGWARMTVKVKGKKEIVYKAPCGRMLRHMGDIHYYLSATKSEMTVDLFDFNQMVRCLAEFSVECKPDPKDLSGGLEQVPIPVINGINNEELEFRNYSTVRIPTEGVKLNLDTEFLCGCDCDDDCIDKTKCSCWRLTLEGAKYLGKDVDPTSVGYIYRRLNDQVLTGIYECNSRCKCNSTCLNRVVQHPLSLKLQVFRTHNRGWGIRALNDVPQGAFICCYAGTIHTEATANEDGIAHGDEYFAELDYIESVEKHKEDYEAEVRMEEDDSDGVRTPAGSDEDDDDEERGHKKRHGYKDDNDFVPTNPVDKIVEIGVRRSLRKRTHDDSREKESRTTMTPPTTLKPEEKQQKMDVEIPKSRNEKMAIDDPPKVMTTKIKQEKMNEYKDEKPSMDSIRKDMDTVTISDDEDDDREVLSFNPKSHPEDKKPRLVSLRELFGPDESVYVMDAKSAGNIGRFLNHSCSPNVFVQNVFVDTHDPRFPWVAFFSSQFIRAGTELVWNYNYDIGSVSGRVLYCHCASLECKGRLL